MSFGTFYFEKRTILDEKRTITNETTNTPKVHNCS